MREREQAPTGVTTSGATAVDWGVPKASEQPADTTFAWVAVHAVAVTALVLGLFFYWFAVADRYTVFLYNHMGATPFDAETSSRYWMAGFVAGGAVLLAYAVANWVPGRLARRLQVGYDAPAWWRVWLLSAAPLAIGIVAITTRMNSPVLPPSLAICCALTALTGLALAIAVGDLAARAPVRLLGLALWAVGLWPALLLLHVLENESAGSMPRSAVAVPVVVAVAVGTLCLVLGARLAARRGRAPVGATALFAAGLSESYLLLPLMHYLLFAPAEYRYISSSVNFVASRWWVQALCLLVAGLQALAAAWLERTWARRAGARP